MDNYILIPKDELYHYGVLGMKWGVRRYQDKNGRLTSAGKEHNKLLRNIANNKSYTDPINEIVNTLSPIEKKRLGASDKEDWIPKDKENLYLINKGKTFIEKQGDVPVSFMEIWTNQSRTGEIAIATRSEEQYRNKGYASKVIDRGAKYINKYGNRTMDEVVYSLRKDNEYSKKIAEYLVDKYDFKYDREEADPVSGDPYLYYKKDLTGKGVKSKK